MEIISTVLCSAIVLFVVYKVLDRLIRIPRIGNNRDRYILITGCDSGFGNAAAKRLDELGCNVFAGCLTETGETELRKVCSHRLHSIPLDVSKEDSVRKAFEYVTSKLPHGKGLWGILNNAGNLTAWGSPDWFSVDDYKKQCEVNLWGMVEVTLTFLPLVKKAKGRIVNTSSCFGRFCGEIALPYSISKYGVEAFTDGIRRAIFYFGCKASMVEPGAFATGMTRMNSYLKIGERSWRNAPPEIKEEHGEEFARHFTEHIATKISESASRNIAEVVDAYEHGLLGRFPRARYVAGWDAKLVYLPLQWLPEWLGDKLWRLNCQTPLPQAVKNNHT